MLLGWLLINTAGFILAITTPPWYPYQYLFYLMGLSLILHFGLLNIFTGFLRSVGVNVTSLFKDPIRSRSLNEFWSKRWNLAFVELTTIAVLRPVKKAYGPAIAFWASFIFSGLLHEMAISLPVKSGFGKPALYFIIQAVLIMTVDLWLKKITNAFTRSIVLLACLFIPIFLLFHMEFIHQVILPLVDLLQIF